MKREEQKPEARSDDLVVNELSEELLVYDLGRHKAHCLNKTAAAVWRHCDGQTTVPKMTTLLEKELNAPVNEEVVWLALDRLGKSHLLHRRVTRPVELMGVSRRDVMKKLGLGGATLALPLITSIMTPTAAQAATIPELKSTTNGTCNGGTTASNEKGCCCEGQKQVCCETSPGKFGCVGPTCVPKSNPSGACDGQQFC